MQEKIYLLLAFLLLLSTIQVFICDNAVYSVLFLILNFCLSALILLILKIELLGFLYIMVYYGAVIFLFVALVITTKKKSSATRSLFFHAFLVLSIFFFIILSDFFEALYFHKTCTWGIYLQPMGGIKFFALRDQLNQNFDFYLILEDLYKHNYSLYFVMIGYTLLLALSGAVLLTIELKEKQKKGVKSQISKSNFFNFFK